MIVDMLLHGRWRPQCRISLTHILTAAGRAGEPELFRSVRESQVLADNCRLKYDQR